jgi:hypothetical protein
MRREGAEFEIKRLGRRGRTNGIGLDPQFLVFANVAHESCVLIKLLLRLLQCRKTLTGLSWSLICRASS